MFTPGYITLQEAIEASPMSYLVNCALLPNLLQIPDRYEITVTDTGPGFDPEKPPKDQERSHIGLRNVRERLAQMCGGMLNIVSAPGKGTCVTITIPKGVNAT